MPLRVLVALHRVGPYHQARLTAAAQAGLELMVLQTRPRSQEYPWRFNPAGPYVLISLTGASDQEVDPPRRLLTHQLNFLLDHYRPQVIVSVGWADRVYHQLLLLAHQRRIPLVIVSDSRWRDEPRSFLKEAIKRQLLRGFSAALVAGRESRSYLIRLGYPKRVIFQPWDVVDGSYFADAAQQVVHDRLHFLCVSRFISKKNHLGLLESYRAYQRQGGRWGLQLAGSGPLQSAIEARIATLPDPARVQLVPFCQLRDLGRLYGLASAFILASSTDQWGLVVNEAMSAGLPCLVSSACGCAADLIEHGTTGWCFDPVDHAGLTELMHTAEQQAPSHREDMVTAAHQRMQSFSLEAFATALKQAVQSAYEQPRFSRRAALVALLLSKLP